MCQVVPQRKKPGERGERGAPGEGEGERGEGRQKGGRRRLKIVSGWRAELLGAGSRPTCHFLCLVVPLGRPTGLLASFCTS